jgi:riboflavin kinase/FMN adenylyltransferase
MKIVSWEDFCAGRASLGEKIGAAFGVFDGLHRGHGALLDKILRAPDVSVPCAVSFSRNPKAVLRPEYHAGELFTLEQKLETLGAYGMEVCILIDFSENFSKLPGRDFLAILFGRADFSVLAVGKDFRCGYRLDTDSESIRSYAAERNVRTEIVQALQFRGHAVSSSRIRKDIAEGRLELAKEILGRPYELDLRKIPSRTGAGERRFDRELFEQVLPPKGVYEVEVSEGGVLGGAELKIGEASLELRCAPGTNPEKVRF